ncbi:MULTISPECIES: M16 family metallopeptidase [Rhizobium]|uniref:Zinc protease-like protein y4wB n=1 Tax=Rhizobium favelukesii TaxID=348824 RepID=W6S276_9HYPH|nr:MULTISPECIES: pitrilysin family protein [Rhizobium]MCS0463650.1 insulinase family protein [Rhizobium favelukesii]UFS84927.1 insulinase family protein [Rhizobium sp. T136]CDM60521.1 putative zinc protease-like protein y4wB [Rhizobium favelukesii]
MTMVNHLRCAAANYIQVLLVLLTFASAMPAQAAITVQEINTSSEVKAWLVEDYTQPLITISFAFRGGSTQDPSAKEGAVRLMSALLDEGAGELDSDAFQEQLDDAGAEVHFDVGPDAVYGSLRVLADSKDNAFALLKRAIEQPRFDQAAVDRIRAQLTSNIIAEAKDPSTAATIAWRKAIYGDHPYSRREEGTEQSLAAVTASDLKALHTHLFARGNLTIAVAGAIDAEALKRDLDQTFGSLPSDALLMEVADAAPKLGQEIRIPYALPQDRMHLAYPGINRKDPQFFAAFLMNHILGGGSFTSRLWNEVREKRGLAYGIESSLVNNEHASALIIETSTRPNRAAEALSLIRTEVRRIAEEGVSEEELEAAKKNIIGGYAINALNSSSAIADTLVANQLDGMGIDYIERRKQLIQVVTVEDVRSAASYLLSADPAVMIVGPPIDERKG